MRVACDMQQWSGNSWCAQSLQLVARVTACVASAPR